jgi:hypothetical protein
VVAQRATLEDPGAAATRATYARPRRANRSSSPPQ